MNELENKAVALNRTLLVLDTRKGDFASRFYESEGYQLAGEVPGVACNSEGGVDSTLYYYKEVGATDFQS